MKKDRFMLLSTGTSTPQCFGPTVDLALFNNLVHF